MRDPFAWALPIGRIFGITVRVHILFIIFVLVMWLKSLRPEKPDGSAIIIAAGLYIFHREQIAGRQEAVPAAPA